MYLVLKRMPHGIWQIHEINVSLKYAREVAAGIDKSVWDVMILKAAGPI